jgi:hypothetical protein
MADDPVTADARSRIGLLRSYAAAIVNTPEALDLDAVMRRFEGALNALDAVLAEHRRDHHKTPFCEGCDFTWPCPTVQAITRELTGGGETDDRPA